MNTAVEQKPGYLVSLIMDYGNGRQVQISGNLPLGTTKAQFDEELDKLRLSTNRQQAFVILRDTQAKLNAEKKMVASLKLMLETYDAEVEKEMARLREDATPHSTGKMRTQVTQTIDNMRAQALNYRQNKTEELNRHQTNVDIYEVTIASVQKEIAGESEV